MGGRLPLLCAVILLCFPVVPSGGWGFYAHERIHKHAVFHLPTELYGFYKHHLVYMTENAVAADKRRYVDEEEGRRHYIDIDYYGAYPFDSLPREWNKAIAEYSRDTLYKYGTLPWTVDSMFQELTDAFRAGRTDQILRLSADIGHYVSDANSPLHTTLNYNGQLTGQEGIHSLWESRLPELFAEEYDYLVKEPYFIADALETMFDIILHSHLSVDTLLKTELQVLDTIPEGGIYTYEERGQQRVRVRSVSFCRAYHEAMNGMVERFFRKSIRDVASFWYSAWVLAGQPELDYPEEKISDKAVPEPSGTENYIDPEEFKGRPDK